MGNFFSDKESLVPNHQFVPNHQTVLQSLKSKPIEILVVEDDPAQICLTQQAFNEAGLTNDLRCVNDGEQALMYVRGDGKYKGVPLPDLIFLDLTLAKVSGLEVLKEIKASAELRHIPIIVWSGVSNPKEVRAVYELNGNCFIQKPTDLTEFLKYIDLCYQFWGQVVTRSPSADSV